MFKNKHKWLTVNVLFCIMTSVFSQWTLTDTILKMNKNWKKQALLCFGPNIGWISSEANIFSTQLSYKFWWVITIWPTQNIPPKGKPITLTESGAGIQLTSR